MDEQNMTTVTSVPVSMDVKQGITTLPSSTTLTTDSHGGDLGFNVASNKGWGIPNGFGLRGGSPGVIGGGPGQVGNARPSSPGSIASNSSSSPPGSGGLNNPGHALPSANNNHPSGSNQWGSPNRNTSQNTNGQPNISGSQINNNPSGNATTQQEMHMQELLGTRRAQAAGKSLGEVYESQTSGSSTNTSSNMNNHPGNPNQGKTALGGSAPASSTHAGPAGQPGSTPSSSVTSKEIQELNDMHEALFSHDGWGGQNVNQDSNWDIPSSPEPPDEDRGGGMSAPAGTSGGGTSGATSNWKLNVNNGTDLWEANLRNGGAPPPAPPTSKTPCRHTHTTNIGGTRGEENDTPDQSNVWTAPPANNAPGPNNAQVSNTSAGQARQMPNKMENPIGWGGHGQTRNGWQGGPGGPQDGFNPGGGNGGGGGWNDDNSKAIGSYGEPPMSQNNSWNKPKTPTNPNSGWGEDGLVDVSNRGVPPNKPSKEDLEQLNSRSTNINLNDALEHLVDPLAPGGIGGGRGPMDGPWGGGGNAGPQRRGPPPPVDDNFDLGLGVGPGGPIGIIGMGPPPQPMGGFPPNPSEFSGANKPRIFAMNQGLLAEIVNSEQPNNQPQFNPHGHVPEANSGISPAHLQLLLQEIQMAVEAGYLSAEILTHPLPTESVYRLSQFLQQVFLQLDETSRQIGENNSSDALPISVQITKTKQAIAHIHYQIVEQQAHNKLYHHPLSGSGGPDNPQNNDFQPPVLGDNRGVSDSGSSMIYLFMALPNNFGSDVGMEEAGQHQTSKLDQWTKLPSLDNTWAVAPRAGGYGWPTDHAPGASQNVNNSGMNQNDDSAKGNSNVNMSNEAWSADLVPEFEPGKPWKGTQMIKSSDDDPTLTPGSVIRSPLSCQAIKGDFLSKNSTSTISSMPSDSFVSPLVSLQSSSNPWSFTPTSSGSTSIANSLAQLNNKWDDVGRRDLWDYNNAPGGSPGYRPPPGFDSAPVNKPPSAPSNSGN